MANIHFVQHGRWWKCAHCGVILRNIPGGHAADIHAHYCGAPWQTKADDIPAEWLLAAPPAGDGVPRVTASDVDVMRIAVEAAEDHGTPADAKQMKRCHRAVSYCAKRQGEAGNG